MEMSKKTIDEASKKMIEKACRDCVETVWDRYEKQQPQCGFGELGVCCRICLSGPCRINPFGEPSKGICGATADTIVARNLLRSVACGAATHVDHAFEAVEMLDMAADKKIPYDIKDEAKLHAVADKLGIAKEGKDKYELSKEVARAMFADFAPGKETMDYLSKMVPQERLEVWRKLGILPRDPDLEIRRVMHQTTMGVDADPVNLLLATAKMGLVDCYSGLKLGTDVQDIVFGTPTPVKTEANLGVLKKDKVNIVVHGHVPFLSEKIVEWARKLESEAIAAGATGVQLSGLCCTGNEVLMRQGVASAGNYLSQELAIITGAVDLMVVDVQCIMPSLAQVAACYHTKLVTTHEIGKIPGAEHVDFRAESADEDAAKIVRMGIEAYKQRQAAKVEIPSDKAEMWGGFSVEAIVGALSKLDADNPLKPLVDNIVAGNVYGAVGIVGCNNPRFPQDSVIVPLAMELVKNNVLVVVTGCVAHALGKVGLMSPEGAEKYAGPGLLAVLRAVGEANGLGGPLPPVLHMGSCVDNARIGDLISALAAYLNVPVPALPVAASAPELNHEKALSIGTWAVDMGLLTHIGMPPNILGSPVCAKVLTEDIEGLTGGKFYVEPDPQIAAEKILEHIKAKREGLGI
ncbi:MAG: anaerobic carbon-monoxide dehydrogenase catalytic subunit [Ruminococcaceae bacterium]|nr:anaerobic carbon-monoxide dehydrogenase catalytic subunit [Oscillospiraceae bacterium]